MSHFLMTLLSVPFFYLRWKEEAKSITTKFQEKSKEHRAKINSLRKENNDLNKELLECQQELTKYKIQDVPRYDKICILLCCIFV